MKRILVVDDDTLALQGLHVQPGQQRHEWDTVFVRSGEQALAEFQRQPFDVILSDVNMPSVHGTRLLRTISERWPQAGRIALSGSTDYTCAIQLVPVAHQVLSKSSDPRQLGKAIERCLDIQELLPAPRLRTLVGRVRTLPPVRGTYEKLMSVLAGDSVTTGDMAEVVAQDSVLAAKVLQTATFAFFGLQRRSANIERAVSRLGVTVIRDLFASTETFADCLPTPVPSGFDLERVQLHSRAVAKVAYHVTAHSPIADDTVLAALLHDIGYWVLAQELPTELGEAFKLARADSLPTHEAERQVIGASHAEIGAYLLGIWGLPWRVVEAVAYHHGELSPESASNVRAALAISNALSGTDETDAVPGMPVRTAGFLQPDGRSVIQQRSPTRFKISSRERLESGGG